MRRKRRNRPGFKSPARLDFDRHHLAMQQQAHLLASARITNSGAHALLDVIESGLAAARELVAAGEVELRELAAKVPPGCPELLEFRAQLAQMRAALEEAEKHAPQVEAFRRELPPRCSD